MKELEGKHTYIKFDDYKNLENEINPTHQHLNLDEFKKAVLRTGGLRSKHWTKTAVWFEKK